jgi:hypothetical protein
MRLDRLKRRDFLTLLGSTAVEAENTGISRFPEREDRALASWYRYLH